MLNEKRQPAPAGYDTHGVSLYYNQIRYTHSLSFKANYEGSSGIARTLQLGSANELRPTRRFMETGLRHYIRTTLRGSDTPLYIFDDHNHALFGLREATTELRVVPGALFIHFDEHDDAWIRQNSKNPKVEGIQINGNSLPSLAETAELAHDCDINRFIAPAQAMGLIGEIWWVEPQFRGVKLFPAQYNRRGVWQIAFIKMGIGNVLAQLAQKRSCPPLVFTDCDYDYFKHIEPGSAREQNDLRIIHNVMRQSGAITSATSPGFIDQERAISLAQRLAV